MTGQRVLAFKDEDETGGQPIGPVYEAVLNEHGFPVGQPQPFDPDRKVVWCTLAQAQQMAAEQGLDLYEV